MSELKTLKDLDEIYTMNMGHHSWVRNLKQEAIKWVKEWEVTLEHTKTIYPDELMDRARRYTRIECNFAIKWTKHFFNITEDDLK